MKCGVIYIKTCPPRDHKYEWLKYCYITKSIPKPILDNIIQIAHNINTKYSNDIIIPMDIMLHPGCTTKPEKVDEIANDMYNQFSKLSETYGFPDTIRCVYSTGELSNINYNSTHLLHHDYVMIKVGHFLDKSDNPGLFKI